MFREFLRWYFQPINETLHAIPPGHAYHCSSCRWVCRDTIQSRCRKCGSTAVLPVAPTVQSLTEPVKARIQEARKEQRTETRPVVVLKKEHKKVVHLADQINYPLYLTHRRGPKDAT